MRVGELLGYGFLSFVDHVNKGVDYSLLTWDFLKAEFLCIPPLLLYLVRGFLVMTQAILNLSGLIWLLILSVLSLDCSWNRGLSFLIAGHDFLFVPLQAFSDILAAYSNHISYIPRNSIVTGHM